MDYLNASKKCDLVMQGGIASGIVYPGAVCKLAEVYRFQNIGGTSAGAIAAAATAAAEYARCGGSSQGFEELSKLPAFLSATAPGQRETNLFWLFQPDRQFRRLQALLLKFNLFTLLSFSPLAWLGSLALAVLLVCFSFDPNRPLLDVGLSLAGALLFVAAGTTFLLVALALPLLRVPGHAFGLCSGLTQPWANGVPAVTDWLTDYLNRIAGKDKTQPLTFGDLRSRNIRLRMVTTCLTHGRPYGLPLDSNRFYFKEAELRSYFPVEIVQWMKDHPCHHDDDPDKVDASGLCPLPEAKDLPVVVAARMSLSFPVLFRAVPLYSVDFSLRQAKQPEPNLKREPGGALQPGERRVPERCWFVDGGLCSNFPLYLFDAPLPRWPTFGLNLQSTRKDRLDEKVWMPKRNEDGLAELWTRLSERKGAGPLLTFLSTLLDTARNWMDYRQITVPGYRDRVVQVRLDDRTEGGLNLNMPPPVVADVSQRGGMAADLLLDHFYHPKPDVSLTWDNHRWVRFRSTLALLEQTLLQMELGLDFHEPGERTYQELLARAKTDLPHSYPLSAAQQKLLVDWTNQLRSLIHSLERIPEDHRFSEGAPRPMPAVRVTPALMTAAEADK